MPIDPDAWDDPERIENPGTAEMLMVALSRVLAAEVELAAREAEHAANVARIEGLEEEFVERGLRLTALETGFTAASAELDGNDLRIEDLEDRVTALESRTTTLETQIVTINASIVTINSRLGLVNGLLHLW